VFALLANPHRHPEFDGSGTVRGAVSGPQQLGMGDRFSMAMKNGLSYRTSNRVVEFEPNRQIAWWNASKAVWRYELEPAAGGTRVTETFDYGRSPLRGVLGLTGAPRNSARSISATLRRLQDIFGAPAQV
jgi:Polyketide cyclase / dehydrase and lipid transport